jgi:hypothetical protein
VIGDFVIDENCTRDFDIGLALLNKVIEKGNEIKYIPRNIFRNQLKTDSKANKIWEGIQAKEFDLKELWELSFYDYVDDSLINKDLALSLVNTITKMSNPNTIHFDRLERFLTVEPNLFQIILRTITDKNEKESTSLQVWMDFFSKHFDKITAIIFLTEAFRSEYEYKMVKGPGSLQDLAPDKTLLALAH